MFLKCISKWHDARRIDQEEMKLEIDMMLEMKCKGQKERGTLVENGDDGAGIMVEDNLGEKKCLGQRRQKEKRNRGNQGMGERDGKIDLRKMMDQIKGDNESNEVHVYREDVEFISGFQLTRDKEKNIYNTHFFGGGWGRIVYFMKD